MDKIRTRTSTDEGALASHMIRIALTGALYSFCGYLSGLATLPFGALPFGIALLAAADRNALFILLGLAIASFGQFEGGSAIVLFGVYAAILLLRILIRLTLGGEKGKKSLGEIGKMLFCEQTGYRVCLSALVAFGLSLAFLVAGGFLYYDLFALLISTAVAPIATYLLSFAFVRREQRAFLSDVGWGALFAICMLGARPLEIYGVSVAVAGGIMLVLIVAHRKGFLRGALLALTVGLVYSPTLCPIFLIPALAWGAFVRFSTTLVSLSSFFGAVGYAFYISGIHALDGTLGGILAACLGFSVYIRVSCERKKEVVSESDRERCRVLDEGELDGVRLSDMNSKMAAMSESLSNISSLFDELELKFPRREEIRAICQQAFEASCAGCADAESCRGASERLADILEKKGELCASDLGDRYGGCTRAGELLDEINYNFAIRFGAQRESGGLDGAQLDGYGYKLISSLLSKGIEDCGEEYIADLGASAALCEPLEKLECKIFGVLVYGNRQKRVLIRGRRRDLLDSAAEQIAATVTDLLGTSFDSARTRVRRFGRGEEGCIELYEGRRYSISAKLGRESRRSGEASGDCVEIFENRDGMSYICLSDGMGSGSDAARTAELAVGFLKNMLARGRVSDELLSMLNSFLKARCASSAQECSATLDLFELDSFSGEATFYKCGAAPTYVCHGGNLFKLRSRTMPLGILSAPDVKELKMSLSCGDLVVLMSDGVSGGREDCPYLFDLLRQNASSPSDARTVELIMRYARSNPEPDDTTVIVARVGS
ncbi:MAG: SpoIIE family protein phosphatase [Clostridia bacterium]|nr:SpoIIE family protein phosphatase [Clostridia bacterium]